MLKIGRKKTFPPDCSNDGKGIKRQNQMKRYFVRRLHIMNATVDDMMSEKRGGKISKPV